MSKDYLLTFKSDQFKYIKENSLLQEIFAKEVDNMAVHHGGKVGAAGKALASKSSSKSTKSKAGTTLANHKAAKH